jgi:hypothetical protein
MGTRIDDINPAQEALLHLLANRSLTSGGLAMHASNKENVKTANAVTYIINGIFYSKSAQTEIDISGLTFLDKDGNADTVSAQAIGYDRIYLLALDASGNVRVSQGADVATGKTAHWPPCPPQLTPFGAVKVANGSSAAFTFGTTTLDTSGLTVTYTNLSVVPAATSP